MIMFVRFVFVVSEENTILRSSFTLEQNQTGFPNGFVGPAHIHNH